MKSYAKQIDKNQEEYVNFSKNYELAKLKQMQSMENVLSQTDYILKKVNRFVDTPVKDIQVCIEEIFEQKFRNLKNYFENYVASGTEVSKSCIRNKRQIPQEIGNMQNSIDSRTVYKNSTLMPSQNFQCSYKQNEMMPPKVYPHATLRNCLQTPLAHYINNYTKNNKESGHKHGRESQTNLEYKSHDLILKVRRKTSSTQSTVANTFLNSIKKNKPTCCTPLNTTFKRNNVCNQINFQKHHANFTQYGNTIGNGCNTVEPSMNSSPALTLYDGSLFNKRIHLPKKINE